MRASDPKMNIFLFSLLYLLACISVTNAAEPRKVSYKHVVSWNTWKAGTRDYDTVFVYLDDRPIGNPPGAFQKLEELPLKPGDRIKLDTAPWNRNEPDGKPVHFFSNFLQIWIATGASIDFYEAGKKLKVHTITWKDFLDKNGHYIEDWDKLTWVIDGKTVGGGFILLKYVEKWVRERDVIVQRITPFGFRPPSGFIEGEYTQRVTDIFISRKVRVDYIIPDTDHPPRKPFK